MALYYFLLPFILGGVFVLGFYGKEVQDERVSHEFSQRHQLDLLAAELSHELRETASGLQILAAHHALADWVVSGDGRHLAGLAQEFSAFAEVTKEYDQVRLLDASGMEKIRVNYRDGKARLVPAEALQNKADRYYFKQIMQLERGQIYISPFDLNEEDGKIAQPLTPVIRFGIPLFDRSGQKQGIILLNYSGRDLIHHFEQHSLTGSELRLLVDSKNLWLQYAKDDALWQFVYHDKNFEAGQDKRIGDGTRRYEAKIGKAETGRFYVSEGLVSFRKLYPIRELHKEAALLSRSSVPARVIKNGAIASERLVWQFTSLVPKEMLYANSSRLLKKLLLIYAFFSVAIAGVAFTMAKTKLKNKVLQESLSESESRHQAWVKSAPFLKAKEEKVRILVVEDEAITALDISRTLKRLGYAVIGPVDTGEEAIEKSESETPDLILMDIHLSASINGLEAAAEIHERFQIPVVFLSAHADRETIEHAKATMASGFLVKPFREQELGIAIEMARYKYEFESNLANSEAGFRAIFEQSSDSALLVEPASGLLIAFNEKAHTTLGYKQEVFSDLKISDIELSDNEEALKRSVRLKMMGQGEERYQAKHRTKSGEIRFVSVTARMIRVKRKSLLLLICQDFTERKQSQRKERLANSVFENVTEGMTITDVDGLILSINAAFTRITGYSAEEVIGRSPKILQSGRHNSAYYDAMWAKIKNTGRWSGEIWNRRKNGEIYPEWLSITAVEDEFENTIQYVGLFSDISQRKATEEKLLFQAHYDPLTELANRVLLRERLSQALKQIHRSQRKLALLFLDLDHFKQVNDTFGHLAGDEILKQTAGRLLGCIRGTDTAARSGGDEFLILLPEIEDRKEAVVVAKKIIEALSVPYQFDGQDAFLGGSIGITIAPDDGTTEVEMIKSADMSLYKAKAQGRNTYRFFTKNMLKTARARTLLEWKLNQALENDELRVYYQPIIDLDSLKTVSLEALVRWKHPKKGLLSPDAFIPIAEESNLICQIGDWVLETACTQMKQWQVKYGIDTSISVNISTRQIKHAEVWQSITGALDKSRLSAKSLTIEITESLMLDPIEEMIEKLKVIKEVGVQLSVDDFGTGYSSLSCLSRFPVDKLKIDKSFILELASNPEKKPLVEAIVKLGQSMHLKVIAEGIEQHEDLSYLRWLRCDMGQGYYFSKPIPADAYEKVLEKQKK